MFLKIAAEKKWPPRLLCVGAGLLTSLAFCAPALGALCLLSLVPLFYVVLRDGRAAGGFFLFGLGYYLPLMSWLYELYPLTDYGLSTAASLVALTLAVVLIALGESAFLALPALVYPVLRRGNGWDVATLSGLYLLGEALQERAGALGFPWGRLGAIPWRWTTFLQSSSLLGTLLLSLVILLINGLLARALVLGATSRRGLAQAGLAALLLGGNLLFGAGRLALPTPPGDRLTVGLVQGNLASLSKWEATLEDTAQRYLRLSEQAADEGARLILWPETAMPSSLLDDPSLLERLREFTRRRGVTLITGAFYQDPTGREYNALFSIWPNGQVEGPSCKGMLVPMGEFIPFGKALQQFFPELNPGLTAGAPTVLATPYGQVGGLICYESIFPTVARDLTKEGAVLLAVASNDSWFGASPALWQHLGHGVLRAAESGRALVRAGNTGISALIDGRGRLVDQAPAHVPAVLTAELAVAARPTLYGLVGDVILLPPLVLWVLGLWRSLAIWRPWHAKKPERDAPLPG